MILENQIPRVIKQIIFYNKEVVWQPLSKILTVSHARIWRVGEIISLSLIRILSIQFYPLIDSSIKKPNHLMKNKGRASHYKRRGEMFLLKFNRITSFKIHRLTHIYHFKRWEETYIMKIRRIRSININSLGQISHFKIQWEIYLMKFNRIKSNNIQRVTQMFLFNFKKLREIFLMITHRTGSIKINS